MASGSRAALAAALVTCVAGSARADVLDDIGKKLVTVEGEARELGSGIKKPTGQPKKDDVLSRRLIDAQVAFGVGNYDNAALLLYDYVAQATGGPAAATTTPRSTTSASRCSRRRIASPRAPTSPSW
jgi:hypothetical protein